MRAVPRRAKLHEKISLRTCSSAERPWGQGSGLAQPTEGYSEVKDTHSRKDHLSLLLLYSVIPFLPSLVLTWPSLRPSSPLPLDLLAGENEGEREREIRHSDTRQESLPIYRLLCETRERWEDVKGRRETHPQGSWGKWRWKGDKSLFSPSSLSLSSSLSLICSDVSGKSRGDEVSPAGFWPQQSDQGHRWEQGRLRRSVLHHE